MSVDIMLRELKTFVAVTQLGSFAAAGQRIGLTQSAVSAQIRSLEEALGMQLFDRSGRTAILNADGNRALPMAEEILQIFSRMAQPENLNDYRGSIKIGAISSIQTGLLPQALTQLHATAPGLETKLLPGVSFNLLTQVEAGNIDLAVVIKPGFPLAKELWHNTLVREPYVLIAPATLTGDEPLALLRSQPFIRYDRTSFGGRQVSMFLREHRLEPKLALEVDEIDAIVKMVESGLGIALVPWAGLWTERQCALRILPLGDLTFYRELIVVTRYANHNAPLHRLIIECLQQAALPLGEAPVSAG
ncbi:LysR family transcriptional regulator [Pantoea cypripedii]|uniref:LysR family transcriptional regulator n=1 Tax=Pantoea cypripedii TaxID=55209 RepID=UPI002FCADD90